MGVGGSAVPPPFAEAVFRRTGGNALFILETLRHLLETDRLGATLPAQLPLSSRVGTIIRGRLARLSEVAQRVVKAAAVLQSDFDLELLGALLQTDPLELLGAWEELEQAQVFSGARFSHDLLLEAALESVSQPVRVLLNRRCAEVLAARRADPERIAKHWFAAGDELAAVPALRAAALRAQGELRLADAENAFEQALAILARYGRAAEAAEVAAEPKLPRSPPKSAPSWRRGGCRRTGSDPTVGANPSRIRKLSKSAGSSRPTRVKGPPRVRWAPDVASAGHLR